MKPLLRRVGLELWSFTRHCGLVALRTTLWSVRTGVETLVLIVGFFYLWASYHVPPGHLLNWPEFRAVIKQALDHAGGCLQ